MTQETVDHFREVTDAVGELPQELLYQVQKALLDCYHAGGTVFVAGNGGSAATASHFACDLAKGTRHDSLPRFRVIALTDNVPLMTAWGNDDGYNRIFAEQLEALLREGDVLMLITGSGNSPNVVEAVEVAERCGAFTIALTGRTGGRIGSMTDLTIKVPADHIEAVEDGHSIISHALAISLRQRLEEEATQPSL